MDLLARCGITGQTDFFATPSQKRGAACEIESDVDLSFEGYVGLPGSADLISALQALGSESLFPGAFAYADDPIGIFAAEGSAVGDDTSGGITIPFEFDKGTGTGGGGIGAWKGDWSSSTSYALNDAVFRAGSSYIAIAANTNHDPATDDGSHWQLEAQKGDTGATGPAGSTSLTRIAAQDLSGQRVVKAVVGGKVDYASADQISDVLIIEGITAGAASMGASVQVQNTGEMQEVSWSWSLGPIFCGLNGQLTQTPPAAAWIRQVAIAVDTDRIIVTLQVPIITP